MRYYQGVDGLKTGYTTEAGYCLTTTAKRNNMRLITVVMNEPDSATRNSETSSMLDYAFSMYKIKNIISKKNVIKTKNINLANPSKIEIVPIEDINILLKKNDKENNTNYKTSLYDINIPIKKGDIIGELKLYNNEKLIKTSYLTVKNDITKVNILKLYLRNIKNIMTYKI